MLVSIATLLPLLLCQSTNARINVKILDVFSDFSFVGSTPPGSNNNSADGPPPGQHGVTERPRPNSLEVGVQYIFHHRAPVDNESLALHELPEMLNRKGFKVTKAPKSAETMMHLVIGGPLFRIEFSDGTHAGVIFNSPHIDVGEGWTDHDYVLVYVR
jgi:hypothetical protein